MVLTAAQFYAPPRCPENRPKAVYVHVPFCLHRCGYCDFTLVAQRDELIPAYLNALGRELAMLDRHYEVDTFFIGGGTPTHLSVAHLIELFDLLSKHFTLRSGGEFSIEANPDGLDTARLKLLADRGVNRLSLGVQSFDGSVLHTLERQHTPEQAADAVHRAAEWFRNVSLDLIFGVPGQTLESWQTTLKTATSLPLTHISTYGLTFEKGTDFFRRTTSGSMAPVPDELERQMYQQAITWLTDGGFQHYEVSNFGMPRWQCRHNQVYWAADEYFAFGPGAARYVNGIRSTNARNVTRWITSWQQGQPAIQESEELTPPEKAREAVFVGLRRNAGIHLPTFEQRFGVPLESLAPRELASHLNEGLLEIVDQHLRLTGQGRFIADTVFADFL